MISALLLAATPSPSPSPLPQADPSLGSPGFIGFVFTFVLALVVIGLGLLMSRELRKVNRNARLAAAAEEAAGQRGPAEPAGEGHLYPGPDETGADEPGADEPAGEAGAGDEPDGPR